MCYVRHECTMNDRNINKNAELNVISKLIKFPILLHTYVSRDSSVSITTRYGLYGPGIDSRWGAKYSALVQTGPESHPASNTVGTGSLSRGLSGRGLALTTHPI